MKKTAPIYIYITMIAIAGFCQKNINSKTNIQSILNKNHYNLDDTLIDRIFKLKEIKDLISDEENLSKSSQSKIAVMIVQKPSVENSNYYFRAGYNEPDIFLTMYQFKLNSKFRHQKKLDSFIYILVDSTGKYIPLSGLRKNKSSDHP